MIKVASGGTAARVEARRMVTEKLESGLALQVMALSGGGGLGLTSQGAARKALAHYRRKVRANRRRLAKGRERTNKSLSAALRLKTDRRPVPEYMQADAQIVVRTGPMCAE
jgi:hypothetical protein